MDLNVDPGRAEAPPAHRDGAHAWRLLMAACAAFAALFAGTLLLPHDPWIRYQQLAPTIQFQVIRSYERIVYDRAPIDVAFIGNSRVQAGVQAPLLSAELSQRMGRPIRVENLALPQEGRNAQSVIADLLLRHHPEVKLLVLSAIEQMPRDGHPVFPVIATPGAVLRAPLLINRGWFADLFALPYRQMSLFVQTLAPRAFGLKPRFDPTDYARESRDPTQSFRTPTGNWVDRETIHTAAELRPVARARVASIHPPLLPAGMARFEFAMDRTYTARIAAEAKAGGTRMAFLYMPIFENHAPVAAGDFYRGFGPILDARFVADDPRNYSDYGHMNRVGSGKVTAWLAAPVARLLEDPAPLRAGAAPSPE